MRILVIDDEADLCEILKFNLETEGYQVDTASSAEEALALDLARYDLLLLDVMMGEMSGFKLANVLRKEPGTAEIPIIFLTARDTENDRLTGFNLGADDYISKPYSLKEVSARVRAVLRRADARRSGGGSAAAAEAVSTLGYRGLVLDPDRVKVQLDGRDVALTKKEFEILRLLLENKQSVLSRETILSKIWRDEAYVLDRTIDVNVTRLRKKIGPYGRNIVTRQGYGYCFETDDE